MNRKSGITLLVLVMSFAVMMIIITSALVAGFNSIAQANYEEYMTSLSRVEDNINVYYLENDKLPITNEIVAATSLGEDFYNNVVINKDDNNRLFIVNISLLNNSTIKQGHGTVANKDVYLVAENTHNVYYLDGFRFRGQTIYGN